MKSLLLFLVVGCVPPAEPTGSPSAPVTPAEPDPHDGLAGLSVLSCASHRQCAPESEDWLGDTCCAFGDSFVTQHYASFVEAVDVDATSDYVVACTGFGGGFAPVSGDFSDFSMIELGNPRCQRIEFGPTTATGQVVYVSHHGDGWVSDPNIWAYELHPDGSVAALGSVPERFLFEDMAYDASGYLYVASHADGLQVYGVDASGLLHFSHTIGGFENLVDVRVEGNRAYLLDNKDLQIWDITDPTQIVKLGGFDLRAPGRDIDIVGHTLYVAEGRSGLEVLDVSDPSAVSAVDSVRLDGTVQSVKANEALIAVSNWTHVSVLDAETRQVVGTERTVDTFEQDLGVAIVDNTVVVAEWHGVTAIEYRQGYAAPDIWVDEEIFVFSGGEASTHEVEVRNRGTLNLVVSGVEADAPFAVDEEGFILSPGESRSVEIAYAPPQPSSLTSLLFHTNDPDARDNPLQIRLHASETSRIDVGDELTEPFAFLDPTGHSDLSNLEGHVTVLAYFALF